MNKKNLRFYEAPMAEVVELKAQCALLAGSNKTEPGETPDPSDMEQL